MNKNQQLASTSIAVTRVIALLIFMFTIMTSQYALKMHLIRPLRREHGATAQNVDSNEIYTINSI